jgi:hypothetical protein
VDRCDDLPVDTTTFWGIIAAARASSGPGKPFNLALTGHLATLTEQDILRYHERFDRLHAALYRWDVWAAAYLIGGGCSDDAFVDFRAGIIAQGRGWYEKVTASPDNLANHPAVAGTVMPSGMSVLFDEMVNYAAPRAFERVTGGKHRFNDAWARYRDSRQRGSQDPAGQRFGFDDPQQMRRRLPRLAAIFLRNDSA